MHSEPSSHHTPSRSPRRPLRSHEPKPQTQTVSQVFLVALVGAIGTGVGNIVLTWWTHHH